MLDVRVLAYVVPLAEQVLDDITPVIQVRNFADEDATITGLIRIYRKTTDTLEYTSELATTILAHGTQANIAALSAWSPGAPADDDYFILATILATSFLPGPPKRGTLGAWTFDIKPGPMGPAPAAHHTTHENGGMDEISVAGLSGILGDMQPVDVHATSHQKGEADAIEIANLGTAEADDTLVLAPDGAGGVEFRAEVAAVADILDLPTAEMDDALILAPDGAGGVEFRAETAGVTDHGALTGLTDDDHTQYRLRHEIFYEIDALYTAVNQFQPWLFGAIAGGTCSGLAGTSAHPGIARLTSSVAANSGYMLILNTNCLILAGGETSRCWHRPQTLAATTRHHGFHSAYSVTDPNDGAWIWQDPATGIIYGRCKNAAGASVTGTSYQLVTNTWYLEKVAVNADATRVDFYLYDAAGNLLWTDNLTTNIPTAAGDEVGHGIIASNSGTTALALDDIDYLSILVPNRRPNL